MFERPLLALDSYKNLKTSIEATLLLAQSIKSIFPNSNPIIMPLSDGGDGLVSSAEFGLECSGSRYVLIEPGILEEKIGAQVQFHRKGFYKRRNLEKELVWNEHFRFILKRT